MADERMVPLLPCASVDEIRDFYLPLGFEVTFQQVRPNPYVALRREGIDLHYFGMEGFRPEDSYGSCLVVVADTQPLFDAFAAGLRTSLGKLPMTGFPRITRPRPRKNADGLSGFSLVDPAGNWIRVVRDPSVVPDQDSPAPSRLAEALANAVVIADSRGEESQAFKVLSGAVGRLGPESAVVDRVEAHAFLAELAVRVEDPARAVAELDAVAALDLSAAEREACAAALAQADELRGSLARQS